jgi:hypothetical protein
MGEQRALNPSGVGSKPTAPATYVLSCDESVALWDRVIRSDIRPPPIVIAYFAGVIEEEIKKRLAAM